MYKVVFFKFFLFVLYLTAGLMGKVNNYFNNTNTEVISSSTNPNESQIGQATIWINPFITRYKVRTTTTSTSTTTLSTRRTARPRSMLLKKLLYK